MYAGPDRQLAVWLNALALRPGGSGVQTYARELIAALTARGDLRLTAQVQVDALGELPTEVRVAPVPVCAGVRRAVRGLVATTAGDVVHGLDVDLPLRSRGTPRVATVHDLSVFDVPWAFSRGRAAAERLLVTTGVHAADELIAVSGFTADRVRDRFGRTATVIHLAPPSWTRVAKPSECREVRERLGLPERFVLQISTDEPRKRLDLLIAAGRRTGLPVVLGGAGTEHLTGPGVLGLGYVSRGDLPAVYGAATIVAYLSTYEGFGLPPLEAMACGAPVLASDVGPMPEVLGGGAVLVRNDEVAVAGALDRLACDAEERADLRTRGIRHAGGFRWQRTARDTAEVYQRLGGS